MPNITRRALYSTSLAMPMPTESPVINLIGNTTEQARLTLFRFASVGHFNVENMNGLSILQVRLIVVLSTGALIKCQK